MEKLSNLLFHFWLKCGNNLDLSLVLFSTQVDEFNLFLVRLNGSSFLLKQSSDLIRYLFIIIILIFSFIYREFKIWRNHRVTVFNGFIMVQSA